jgi:hypothetical protein
LEKSSGAFDRHRARTTRRRFLVATFTAALAVLAVGGFYYRVHLFWWWYARRHPEANVKHAIQVRPMPPRAVPDDWVRCRVGRITLSLPPELAHDGAPHRKKNGYSFFQGDARVVGISAPMNAADFAPVLAPAANVWPGPAAFNVINLRLACYQADSDDFRCSMTPGEARWHAIRLTMRPLLEGRKPDFVETLFRKDLDGTIEFVGDRAVFACQTTDGAYSVIHLVDRRANADRLDSSGLSKHGHRRPGREREAINDRFNTARRVIHPSSPLS